MLRGRYAPDSNQRLGLEGEHGLKENNYEGGFFVNSDKSEGGWEHTYEIEGSQKKWVSGPRKITKGGDGRSPVIRFYWGYRAADTVNRYIRHSAKK